MPRAVIVAGARTPFVRAFAEFTQMDAIALGVAAVKGLLDKKRLAINLEGPTFFSLAVGGLGRDAPTPKAYLTWYKIAEKKEESEPTVTE